MVAGVEDQVSGLETVVLLPAQLRAQARAYEFILGEDVSASSSDLVPDIRAWSHCFSLDSGSAGALPHPTGARIAVGIQVAGLPGN